MYLEIFGIDKKIIHISLQAEISSLLSACNFLKYPLGLNQRQ